MTDVPEGSGQVERGAGRRPPRVGDSGSPVGSTLSIILAVVAVVAGFLILRSIFDDDDGSAGLVRRVRPSAGPATTAPAENGTTATTVAPTTTLGRVTDATLVVANASGIGGSAGQMTTALEAVGYTLGEATDSTEGQQDTSRRLLRAERCRRPGRPPSPSPAKWAACGSSGCQPRSRSPAATSATRTVLVMLGTDAAGKTLAELNPTSVTAPSVAGTTTTTTG